MCRQTGPDLNGLFELIYEPEVKKNSVRTDLVGAEGILIRGVLRIVMADRV